MNTLEIFGIFFGLSLFSVFLNGILYSIFKNRLKKMEKAAIIELTKTQDLLALRGQGIVKEYLAIVDWANDDLGKEIMKMVYFDSKLLILKDRSQISDADYSAAFESFITNLNLEIKLKVQKSINTINDNFLKELKERLKDERTN